MGMPKTFLTMTTPMSSGLGLSAIEIMYHSNLLVCRDELPLPSASVHTTASLHRMIHEGQVDLNPPYQRGKYIIASSRFRRVTNALNFDFFRDCLDGSKANGANRIALSKLLCPSHPVPHHA